MPNTNTETRPAHTAQMRLSSLKQVAKNNNSAGRRNQQIGMEVNRYRPKFAMQSLQTIAVSKLRKRIDRKRRVEQRAKQLCSFRDAMRRRSSIAVGLRSSSFVSME